MEEICSGGKEEAKEGAANNQGRAEIRFEHDQTGHEPGIKHWQENPRAKLTDAFSQLRQIMSQYYDQCQFGEFRSLESNKAQVNPTPRTEDLLAKHQNQTKQEGRQGRQWKRKPAEPVIVKVHHEEHADETKKGIDQLVL